MRIEIQETHPAAPGKKMAAVVALGGQRYSVWPEQLAALRIGEMFDVEVESWERNGRKHHKIVQATPVNGTASHTANSNGAAKPASNGSGSAPAVGPVSATEAAFVRELLVAMVMKGDVVATNKRQMFDAALMLRGLYGATFRGCGNGQGGGHE